MAHFLYIICRTVRPMKEGGDVGARVHIYTTTVIIIRRVASPTLGSLYAEKKTRYSIIRG